MVALVAGQVGDPALPLGLDEAEHVSVEPDCGVEIRDAQRHVPDAGDAVHAPAFAGRGGAATGARAST